MGQRQELPDELGPAFPAWIARAHGVTRSRLRGGDMVAPFHGVRIRADAVAPPSVEKDPYLRQGLARIARARDYEAGRHTGHFFSHHTAVSIWGGPLPLEFTVDGRIAEASDLDLHVSASGAVPFPRTRGVIGHRTLASMTEIVDHDGLRLTSPSATWAALGTLPLFDLVALGDYFCRLWRPGAGRRHVGRAPLATAGGLQEMLATGRRRGAKKLRTALELIREDSWSPRETRVRCILIDAGLPEPELNIDVFDDDGTFLGCVDMAYRDRKIAIEYLGMLHSAQWARDVERIAALRAAGWTVIEVTSPLLRRPEVLAHRVRSALG